jgi:glycosyltransferase involved in cell wall biosynthesis
MPKLSVVVPVYREAEGLRQNYVALKEILDQCDGEFTYEIIFVNDGSTDGSLAVMESLQQECPAVTGVVSLTRNFGQVAAIFAGLGFCSGDCAAVISSDLQDPPELIPVMFRKWREGAKTVLGTRRLRNDRLAAKFASRIFYRMMKAYAVPSLPATGFDFFLLDRAVIVRILAKPEPNAFLQGHILYVSGTIAHVPYDRRQRSTGTSGWGFFRKLKYFIDGFIAYSFMPIRLITAAGILLFCVGVVSSFVLVLQRLFWGTTAAGWTSVMIAMLLLHGTEMLMLGVVGEYVWRALDQARGRPIYIVDRYVPPAIPATGESNLRAHDAPPGGV